MSSTFDRGSRCGRAPWVLLVAVLLALGIVFGAPVPAHASTTVYLNQGYGSDANSGASSSQPVKTIDRAAELAGEGGAIVLTSVYSVPSGTTVEVSGITVKRGQVGQTLFSVNGTLVLDCEVDGSGDTTGVAPIVMLTGGTLVLEVGADLHGANCTDQPGGAICAYDGSKVEMNGGKIRDNFAQEGSAIQLWNGSVANLNGGIIENNSENWAGTVEALLNSEVNLAGTIVRNNADDACNGAIYLEGSSGTFSAGSVSSDEAAVTMRRWEGSDGTNVDPSLKLCGADVISAGSIQLIQDGPADDIHVNVAQGFSTSSPVEISPQYTMNDDVLAVAYDGVTPAASDFMPVAGSMGNVLSIEGSNIVWKRSATVNYYKYDDGASRWVKLSSVQVAIDALVPTDSAPEVVLAGYETVWARSVDKTWVAWDFSTGKVAEGGMNLYATYKLRPATVSVTGDTTAHEKSLTLTANVSHDLEGCAFTYQWMRDGKDIEGATSATLEVSESGSYSVRVVAAAGKQTATTTSDAVNCTITRHEYGEWTVTKKPTATSEGVETRTCRHCSATETRTVAKLTGQDDKAEKSAIPQTGDNGTGAATFALMASVCLACAVVVARRS